MIKRILLPLLALLLFSSLLHAKKIYKRYPIKSGIILYDINTTGTSDGLTTNTIGVARLVFDDWGARELKEDDATEIQSGDFNEESPRHTMSRLDYGTVYTVDFDENITYQTRDKDMDIAIAQGADLSMENLELLKESGAVKGGTSTVAGYPCTIWKTENQTVCLHKGIPLIVTIEAPNFRSSRTAQVVVLDKPVPKSEFALPGFAVMLDEEYTTNASAATRTADYIAAVGELTQKVKEMGIDLADPNATITPSQEKVIINTLGDHYLDKQKRLLPKLMVVLKGAKECINNAKSGTEAEACIKPVNRVNEELGDRTAHYDFKKWDSAKKAAIIDTVDKEINYLKVTIGCVNKHSKTTDVIMCTEGNLGTQE